MEPETISKNGTNPKSQTSRGHILRKACYAVIIAVLSLTFMACDKDDNGGNTVLNGTWRRGNNTRYYQIEFSGKNWVYSEGPAGNIREYSKGTWSSNSTISAPSTGTVTITIRQISPLQDGKWQSLPSDYNDIKTNSATYVLNDEGNLLTISNATFTTSGVWGTLEGAYQKQ